MAIARAIAKRPSIVLADEPTGNLDSKSGGEVLELLHGLADDGATLVLITHDEHIAQAFPRRIQMRDGEIVGDDRSMSTADRRAAAPSARLRSARAVPPRELFGVALQGLRSAQAARGAVGARDRDRDRRDGRRRRRLVLEPGEPAGDDRQPRHEPADGRARHHLLRRREVLPDTAVPMINHMQNVDSAVAIYQIPSAIVLRTPFVPSEQTGGIGVDAAGDNLPQVVGTLDGLGAFPGRRQ